MKDAFDIYTRYIFLSSGSTSFPQNIWSPVQALGPAQGSIYSSKTWRSPLRDKHIYYNEIPPLSEINTLEIFVARDCKNEIWTTRRYSDGQSFEDFLSLDIFSWSQSELWAEIKFSWSNLLQIVSINWLSSLLTVYILFTEHWECIAHSHVFFWCFIRALITIL